MKCLTAAVGMAAVLWAGAVWAESPAANFPFYVYKDGGARENQFSPSGFTGDYGAIQMNDKCSESPSAGDSCLKFIYTGKTPQKMNWAAVFFQNPANNWGTSDGGYALSGAKRLRFYARGGHGGESVEFKFGGVNGAFSDSDTGTTGPIRLTREWKAYEIRLDQLDLSYIFSGFAWIAESEKNPDGFTLYLDEIVFVNE